MAGRTVFVIDVLRATTTICAALANGARACIPVGTDRRGDAAGARPSSGARSCSPASAARFAIEGFDLGNSPLEMTESVVRGKTVIMTTTNGTAAAAGDRASASGVYRRRGGQPERGGGARPRGTGRDR